MTLHSVNLQTSSNDLEQCCSTGVHGALSRVYQNLLMVHHFKKVCKVHHILANETSYTFQKFYISKMTIKQPILHSFKIDA